MNNNVIKLNNDTPNTLITSMWEVESTENNTYSLKQGALFKHGTLAFSCMVQPIAGDKVVCFENEHSDLQIMAISERPTSEPIQLSFPQDTILSCPNGSIDIVARKDARILAHSITQVSENWNVKSKKVLVDFLTGLIKGSNLKGSFQSVTAIADIINTNAKQALQKFVSYVRKTEQLDQTEAGQIGLQTKGMYSVRSKHSMLLSKKDTRIDGEHIHMG